MNTQNARTANLVKRETTKIETDHKGVRILRTTPINGLGLEIADNEADTGGDPYNSTGQHCIIKRPK